MAEQSTPPTQQSERAEQIRNELGQVVVPAFRIDPLTLQTLKDHLIFVEMPSAARAALVNSCTTAAEGFMPDDVLASLREASQANCRYWKLLVQASAAVCAAQDAGDPTLLGVRYYVAERWGECNLDGLARAVDWLVAVHGLTKEQAEDIALPDFLGKLRGRPRPVDTSHSEDYRSVRWFGTDYVFTPAQAACVRVLWGAWERGSPVLSQAHILEAADCTGSRLRDVFEKGKHPAFNAMIKSPRKGAFCLTNPA
jgi:hypothetical protein